MSNNNNKSLVSSIAIPLMKNDQSYFHNSLNLSWKIMYNIVIATKALLFALFCFGIPSEFE